VTTEATVEMAATVEEVGVVTEGRQAMEVFAAEVAEVVCSATV
jgi:hypothetical protein